MANSCHAVSFKREMNVVSYLKRVRCDFLAHLKNINLTRGITVINSTFLNQMDTQIQKTKKKCKTNLANTLPFAVESKRAKAKLKICPRLTC